jgi:hypothetical protein
MSVITTIQSTDLIADSRADINTNFANLNSDKIETSALDTDTTLAANSDAKIPSQKAVKAYVDAGGNVNASETAKGIVEEATDAEVTAGTATGGTGAKLFVTPAKLATRLATGIVKFGGNGADGALTITSGATNIDLGSAQVVEKNYTSISITGTGSLTFSNPHASGTVVILKSQGAVTLTSSAAPMIDASSLGAAGAGSNVVTTETIVNGGAGTDGAIPFNFWATGGGVGGTNSGVNTAAGAALATALAYKITSTKLFAKYTFAIVGSGGGAGAARRVSGSSAGTATGGAGGRGGGCLLIECGGAWNFTTSNGISVKGGAGSNGNCVTGNRLSAGGGSGGGGGFALVRYNSLTANSGTIDISGGAGGTGAHIQTGGAFQGVDGAGGASSYVVGSTGTAGTSGAAGNGGAGGAGYSIVEANTELA